MKQAPVPSKEQFEKMMSKIKTPTPSAPIPSYKPRNLMKTAMLLYPPE
jgi:hypothetical protein